MNQNRGGWVPRGNSRQRGSRSRGPPKQFNRPGGPPPKKNTLKFDGDYDFDKANTEFEELRSRFVKVKIGNGKNFYNFPKFSFLKDFFISNKKG